MSKPVYDSETKVWSGPRMAPLYNPNQNLGQLILSVLEQTPNAVTQVSADTDVEVTCSEMRERILKIAAHLRDIGLQQGDVVGVVAENSENLAPLVFACFLLGLPVNPLSTAMIETDLIEMYSITKPKLIFCDRSILETVENAVSTMESDAKIYTIMEQIEGFRSVTEVLNLSPNATDFVYPEVDASATAIILCTSGSTSSPKGVIKSHENAIIECYPSSGYLHAELNVLFQYSAIFWFSGYYFMVQGTLYKYKRIITPRGFNRDDMIGIINKYKVTHTFLSPFAIVSLLQKNDLEPLESIKWWLIGGSAVGKPLSLQFKPFIPNAILCAGYGCSEQGILTLNRSSDRFGSCGSPANNTHLKIIDDNGNALDNNQVGEICSKVPSKFLGYFNEPERSREAFDGEWFKTGDIGYFDNDGFLFFVDRKKEMLRYRGFQVTPTELEAVINEIKGVASSCVVGVMNSVNSNDIIHAFVIPHASSGLTETFIRNYVNDRVMDAKRIRGDVHFVKSFPVGLTGKVDRKQLRKLAAQLSENALKERVVKTLIDACKH